MSVSLCHYHVFWKLKSSNKDVSILLLLRLSLRLYIVIVTTCRDEVCLKNKERVKLINTRKE